MSEDNQLTCFDFSNEIKKTHAKFKGIDLFAGIGGIRLGFEQVFKKDIDFVFSSEIDKFAKITYFENFKEVPYGDITQINPIDIPSFDILLAGFPCQPFSNAGLKKGFSDTRGSLFFDIARIIEHHKPKVVFLENVKGFKGHDKGNTFRVVKETLENLGYKVFFEVLNAKDFGVPQNRERIYIIAFLDKKINFRFPEKMDVSIKVGDILDNQVDEKYTSTLSARYYKDGSEVLIQQEHKNPRKLSPREAGRLQGFPDEFNIVVSDVQAYKQFGNSVAVPAIKELAKHIQKEIDK
ncbi:MAG: DNA cytosine methyltransferase [Mariprofundaceae bacterium]|nr:DNA cytosine methyltransferase [Mariprofundaceae bacterium]